MSAALPALYLTRERPGDIARLDRDGALQRVRAGVYVRRSEWAALMPWERYRLRVHAVARTWLAPVFCLESAASELGLPLVGEARHIHLLSPDEMDPSLDGDLELEDVETEESVQVSLDWATKARYQQWLRTWFEEIEAFCSRRGITYLRVETSQPVEEILLGRLQRERVLR